MHEVDPTIITNLSNQITSDVDVMTEKKS
jgi:hypothetical protein